ncbi:hypothetical protein FF2_004983 [Malus domestica]
MTIQQKKHSSHPLRKEVNQRKGTSVTFAKGDLLNRAELVDIIYIETCTQEMCACLWPKEMYPKRKSKFLSGIICCQRRLAELN